MDKSESISSQIRGGMVSHVPLLHDAVWHDEPAAGLRRHENGTRFLLRQAGRSLHVHVCELHGNLPGDESWKALRLSDMRLVRLETLRGSKYAILPRLDEAHPSGSPPRTTEAP